MDIVCPVSPGELIDKITILELKLKFIKDPEKKRHVSHELEVLMREKKNIHESSELNDLTTGLRDVNLTLWKIEDDIRVCEANQSFGDEFVQLARSVYKNNDTRANLKHRINVLLNSRIIEEKSYQKY